MIDTRDPVSGIEGTLSLRRRHFTLLLWIKWVNNTTDLLYHPVSHHTLGSLHELTVNRVYH